MNITPHTDRGRSSSGRTDVINIRTTTHERILIDQAAAFQGKTRSEFMLEAARREAVDTLLDQSLFNVDANTYNKFISALDAVPKDNAKLRKLLQTKSPWE